MPLGSELLVLGTVEPVLGTPYDFLTPQRIGNRIDQVADVLGYDIGYIPFGLDAEQSKAAVHDCVAVDE